MTLALTRCQAYGIEMEEAVAKKYRQIYELTYTAANTDVALDIGTYAGTFWTAVGATAPGINALLAIKDIQTRAETFMSARGTGIAGKVQADAIYPAPVVLAGTVGAGSATPTATVTGLATSATDTILAVTQDVKGAGNLPLLGYNTQAANALGLVFSADPGASGTIKVTVLRTNSTVVQAGTYQLSMNATNTQLPDILFVTGDAPTTGTLVLEWMLKPGIEPVYLDAVA